MAAVQISGFSTTSRSIEDSEAGTAERSSEHPGVRAAPWSWVILGSLLLLAAPLCVLLLNRASAANNLPPLFHLGNISYPAVMESLGSGRPQAAAAPKLILLYDGFYHPDRHFVEYDFNFSMCRVKNCRITGGKSLLPLSQAVFFHSPYSDRLLELQGLRDSLPAGVEQYWVWMNAEPPRYMPDDTSMDGLFNLSMTFLLSSDVPFLYGDYQERGRPMDLQVWEAMTGEWFHSKSRDVAWSVSHCETSSRREDYVRRLNLSIPVNVYGKCQEWSPISSPSYEEFFSIVKADYKMYLAFENSLCQDYITEKMWVQALQNFAIPVVRGGQSRADYIKSAPPGSFIDTRDFATPQDLAAHMKAVAADVRLFRGYHAWRRHYELKYKQSSQQSWEATKELESYSVCRLCDFVNRHNPRIDKFHYNVSEWDSGKRCIMPSDILP